VGVWKPTKDGKIECTRHEATFPKGGVCALCAVDPPPASSDGAPAAKKRRPRRGKLASTADHEAAFMAIAELADEWARQEDEDARNWVPPAGDVKVVGGPSRGTAAKLLDVSIKARRAACALAQAREDWANTERLEKAARELNEAGGRMRVRAASAEVRH
jgi:hypothetical protein